MSRETAKDLHIKLASIGLNDQGTVWDDGGHQKIEKIVIGYTPSAICSLQVVYSDGGNNPRVLAPHHGASSCSLIKTITVREPITRIHGTYCSTYPSGITSLHLSSNSGSYCQIGTGGGLSFTFESDSGFTGFHGRADGFQLKALGAYVSSTASKRVNDLNPDSCSIL